MSGLDDADPFLLLGVIGSTDTSNVISFKLTSSFVCRGDGDQNVGGVCSTEWQENDELVFKIGGGQLRMRVRELRHPSSGTSSLVHTRQPVPHQ